MLLPHHVYFLFFIENGSRTAPTCMCCPAVHHTFQRSDWMQVYPVYPFEWKWKNENEIQLTELPLTSTKSFILTGPSLPQVYVVIMLKTVTGTDCGDFCPSTSARFCYINVFCLSYIDNSVYWNSYPENFNCIITLCLQCDGSYS